MFLSVALLHGPVCAAIVLLLLQPDAVALIPAFIICSNYYCALLRERQREHAKIMKECHCPLFNSCTRVFFNM